MLVVDTGGVESVIRLSSTVTLILLLLSTSVLQVLIVTGINNFPTVYVNAKCRHVQTIFTFSL